MTPVIITLIIIGVVLIIVSCFVLDKPSDKINGDTSLISTSYINSSDLKLRVEDTLLEVSEDTVAKTEDALSKISNEKIIAVNDFSNLVLDKITTNHEEVVFLYNMLNEKEAELKELISRVNQIKIEQKNNNHEHSLLEPSKESEVSGSKKMLKPKTTHNSLSLDSNIDISETDIEYDELGMNNYDRILELHKEGKSLVEIAKKLKLGQGEVKLVIELYR